MIPYAELDRALALWKARKAAATPGSAPRAPGRTDGGLPEPERPRHAPAEPGAESAGSLPRAVAADVTETQEMPVESSGDSGSLPVEPEAAAPAEEAAGESTGEIDVAQIEDAEEI